MKHWTEDDFREWLYGLKERDAHAETCPECSTEFDRLAAQRRAIVTPPEVSEAFLAAQRRNIYSRLEHSDAQFRAAALGHFDRCAPGSCRELDAAALEQVPGVAHQ